jgi:hypothetical protein
VAGRGRGCTPVLAYQRQQLGRVLPVDGGVLRSVRVALIAVRPYRGDEGTDSPGVASAPEDLRPEEARVAVEQGGAGVPEACGGETDNTMPWMTAAWLDAWHDAWGGAAYHRWSGCSQAPALRHESFPTASRSSSRCR